MYLDFDSYLVAEGWALFLVRVLCSKSKVKEEGSNTEVSRLNLGEGNDSLFFKCLLELSCEATRLQKYVEK